MKDEQLENSQGAAAAEFLDPEYHALRMLNVGEDRLSQRSISRELGLSLGMTNTLLRKLGQKGFLVMRRINGRNLAYALTPAGTRELARRALRYLRRTLGSVERWKDQLEQVLSLASAAGFRRVQLVGSTDFAFILEHLCRITELELVQVALTQLGTADKKTLEIVSESYTDLQQVQALCPEKVLDQGRLYLQDLL